TNLPARISAIVRLGVRDGEMGNDCGLSAADLDDRARLEVPDHAVKSLSIAGTAITVRIGEGSPAAAPPFQGTQCLAEVELRKQLRLRIEVPIDTGESSRSIRVAKDALGTIGGLVVVIGQDRNARPIEQPADGRQCRAARCCKFQERQSRDEEGQRNAIPEQVLYLCGNR